MKKNKFGKKFVKESLYGIEGAKDVDWAILYKGCKIEPSEFYGNLGEMYDEEHPEDPGHDGFDDWCWENKDLIESELEHLASYDDDYEGDDYYKESSISDYDTDDYGDENYEEPDEFDAKTDAINQEWEELGTKSKDEFCERLMYSLGYNIAIGKLKYDDV